MKITTEVLDHHLDMYERGLSYMADSRVLPALIKIARATIAHNAQCVAECETRANLDRREGACRRRQNEPLCHDCPAIHTVDCDVLED